MAHTFVFTPEAQQQLVDLYQHIADTGHPQTAARYTEAIVAACESLRLFPPFGVYPATTSAPDCASRMTNDALS